MDDFAAQEPDEGYSEDPLNPTTTQTSAYLAKPRSDAVSALAATRSTVEFPDWLMSHIASLSVHDKTRKLPPCHSALCDKNKPKLLLLLQSAINLNFGSHCS